MTTRLWLGTLAALGCAAQPDPVPMLGTAAEVSVLAGQWYGEYSSDESGRSGTIIFNVQAGSDTAHGDVLMAAPGVQWNVHQIDASQIRDNPPPDSLSRVIRVSFVRVEGGQVNGRLQPYTDPRCACAVLTEFLGQLAGDTLSGTYTTRLPDGVVQRGRWRVERRR